MGKVQLRTARGIYYRSQEIRTKHMHTIVRMLFSIVIGINKTDLYNLTLEYFLDKSDH
jgi:hypothetical protein